MMNQHNTSLPTDMLISESPSIAPSLWLGISGLGRIGRLVTRLSLQTPGQLVVAINDPLMTIEDMVYAIQHDSVHGRFPGTIVSSLDKKSLIVHTSHGEESISHTIAVSHFAHACDVPWHSSGVDFVFECSGKCLTSSCAYEHRDVRKVIISAPPQDDTPQFVPHVNTDQYIVHTKVLSCASCTTNCLAPLAMIVDNVFGIVEGTMTTIHALTASNHCVDGGSQKQRGCLDNIIPTTTGAAKAIAQILPRLDGKITCSAYRVPVSDVSVLDFTVRTRHSISREALGAAIKGISLESLAGIIDVVTEPCVSSDFRGDKRSCIVDLQSCSFVNDHFVKIVAFYDNEMSYAQRMLDLAQFVEAKDKGAEGMKMLKTGGQ